MKLFDMEYDIVCIKDTNQINLFSELRKLEVKFIKDFSKEKICCVRLTHNGFMPMVAVGRFERRL